MPSCRRGRRTDSGRHGVTRISRSREEHSQSWAGAGGKNSGQPTRSGQQLAPAPEVPSSIRVPLNADTQMGTPTTGASPPGKGQAWTVTAGVMRWGVGLDPRGQQRVEVTVRGDRFQKNPPHAEISATSRPHPNGPRDVHILTGTPTQPDPLRTVNPKRPPRTGAPGWRASQAAVVSFRNAMRLSRRRVFIVPTGTPARAAASGLVKPSKYVSCNASC